MLINTVAQRALWSSDAPPILDHGVTSRHTQSGFPLRLDGVVHSALIIDTDHDVGWALQVGTLAGTVAIDRDRAATIDVALEARTNTPGASTEVEENSHG